MSYLAPTPRGIRKPAGDELAELSRLFGENADDTDQAIDDLETSLSDTLAGLLLAKTYYYRGSVGTVASTTSTTSVDIDATNVAVDFTVPDSGEVIVELEANLRMVGAGCQAYLSLREGSTVLQESEVGLSTSGGDIMRPTASWRVTGLTPGASKTYKGGFRKTAGGSSLEVRGGPAADASFGPVVLKVWSA